MTLRRFLAIATFLLCSFPLFAIFGVGDIVWDPISYANDLVILAELVKSYEQLTAQLELQIRMAKSIPVDMANRYRTIGAAWYGLKLPNDRFGNLSAWLQAVNQGGDARAGYEGASVELKPYDGAISKLSVDEQTRTANRYASVELADGANIHSMETIGMLRSNAAAVDQSIAALENDSLSQDPAMNTEVGVLNKINAASVASLRISRDANRALLSVLEQQVTENKRQRDANASEIDTQIARLAKGDAEKAAHTSTITDTLRTFRWK